MIVAGGVYREACVTPNVENVFGSGGRAAAALARAGHAVTLHTFCPSGGRAMVEAALGGANVDLAFYDSTSQPFFRYLHPLAQPVVWPWPIEPSGSFTVEDEVVLRFGMMEGEAVVRANVAVFDPQSPTPARFRDNGSTANRLALISNSDELKAAFPGVNQNEAAAALARDQNAEVVVVKGGAVGAYVYQAGRFVALVPPYASERVYKVGSGDIFSGAFAHAWALQDLAPEAAADFASRSVARYCESRDPVFESAAEQGREAISYKANRRVYLAGPFFTVADLWLVEEAARCLRAVGAEVFSPYHEVGLGDPNVVATADLAALDECSAVLAIISGGDAGTLFEVGYAIKAQKPVIALAENTLRSDETMLTGTGCEIVRDLATAVYRAAWASWR